jgi:hypothetical protein
MDHGAKNPFIGKKTIEMDCNCLFFLKAWKNPLWFALSWVLVVIWDNFSTRGGYNEACNTIVARFVINLQLYW